MELELDVHELEKYLSSTSTRMNELFAMVWTTDIGAKMINLWLNKYSEYMWKLAVTVLKWDLEYTKHHSRNNMTPWHTYGSNYNKDHDIHGQTTKGFGKMNKCISRFFLDLKEVLCVSIPTLQYFPVLCDFAWTCILQDTNLPMTVYYSQGLLLLKSSLNLHPWLPTGKKKKRGFRVKSQQIKTSMGNN